MQRTKRRHLTAVQLAVAVVASALALVVAPAAATADPPPVSVTGAPCAPGVGVTVVVDAQTADGVKIGCAPGVQTNGFTALTNAGFTYNEDYDAGGAICQIGHHPATAYPDCWYAGFWAYWKSDGATPWAYSNTGADAGPLPVDSVEGWGWTQPVPDDYSGSRPRLTVADVKARAAAVDCTAVPQLPTFSIIDDREILPVTMTDGAVAEVAVIAPDADPATAAFAPASTVALTGHQGPTRIVARRAGTTCPTPPLFDATFDVRGAYAPRWEDTTGPGTPSPAIDKADPAIEAWATGHSEYTPGGNVNTSYQTPENAYGPVDGTLVVLGDRGSITLTFDQPITDGDGDDFAAFENGFKVGALDFLEFAYVEVSSNGTDFVRFDSASRREAPVGSYAGQLASEIGGLAGKDLNGKGTPFDLALLKHRPEVRSGTVDLTRITHVRLKDVQGDGNDRDSFGRPIYDPNPSTGSAGYDLNGLAVLHQYVAPPEPTCAAPLDGNGGEAAALTWLGCQLERNGGVVPGFSPGTADYGQTLEAAMAYALDGRPTDPHAVTAVDKVQADVRAYVTDAGFGDGNDRYAGPMAKLLLALELQGESAHDVDGLDLEAELRARMQTTGVDAGRFSDLSAWGDYSNGFGQALSLLALSHTDDGIPAPAVTFLLAQQCPDGGFRGAYATTGGCKNNTEADTDYTALAVQALRSAPQTAAVTGATTKGADWLVAHQSPSGAITGSGITAGDNTNSTGLAAQALRGVGRTAAADRAAGWIRTQQLDAARAGTGPAATDLGAIAYNQAGFDTALTDGVTDGSRDQWRRATVQALLAFDAPIFGVPGVVPPRAPYAPFASWDAFVTQQYRDFLGRAPSASERSTWTTKLSSGAVPAAELPTSLATVTDVNGLGGKLHRLYNGVVLRPPTEVHFNQWATRIGNGMSMTTVVQGFLDAADSPYKGMADRPFVAAAWSNILGRPAPAAAVDEWAGRLRAGWSRAQFVAHLVETSEAKTRSITDIRVWKTLKAMRGTWPTKAPYWAARTRVWAGTPLETIVTEILADPAYAARVG